MSEKEDKATIIATFVAAVLEIVVKFAFWGGLIYLVFWCLKHFGAL